MKYVVVFLEGYVGEFFNEECKMFDNRIEAEKYADELNVAFAKENHCRVDDLGDYYVVEEIE